MRFATTELVVRDFIVDLTISSHQVEDMTLPVQPDHSHLAISRAADEMLAVVTYGDVTFAFDFRLRKALTDYPTRRWSKSWHPSCAAFSTWRLRTLATPVTFSP